ncbi:MAG TPA: AraC family transcriptional regulator ligand-binding domain-containing protein [Rubrivivax sp.]|nr:AraC family transcriptional regulator ligand-binding domain-containing protein [Rubrivivax sp.]
MNRPSRSFDEKLYLAHKIAAVVAALDECGVSAAEALHGTALSESRFATSLVSYRQMRTVFDNAQRLSAEPTVALIAGRKMRFTAFGMYGYALMSSPNHAAAIDFAVKYQDVMAPMVEMSFTHDGEAAAYAYEPILEPDPSRPLYRFALEFQFASHHTIMTDLYGKAFRFSRISTTYEAPAHARAYARLFKCPVHFAQAVNEVRFDAAWIERPMSYANPITYAMAHEACERDLQEVVRAGSVAGQVHRLLITRAGRFPDIDEAAAELALNARTLRRKLDAEQTSYRKILAEVRMHLAIEYLRKTRMTNEEIAARLGYSDAANFRHAFKRWTFRHPSDFRGR